METREYSGGNNNMALQLPNLRKNTTMPPPPSVQDENSNPTVDTTSTQWKAHVPSVDRRLVLSAIGNQVAVSKNAWKEKNSTATKDKEEFVMECLDQTASSLVNQLESVTIPVDEAELERVLESFKSRQLSTMPLSPGTDDESLSSSSDEEDEDYEFDDDEIIDEEAYNKVKQFRSQAREIAARVISIREEASGRALGVTHRGLSELLSIHGFSENLEDEQHISNEESSDKNDESNQDGCRIEPMNVALRCLTSSLQNVDSRLVEKIENLKESVTTIDTAIEKYQRMSQGDENVLSQPEKALLLDKRPKETFASIQDSLENSDSPMNDDAKLALLLAGFL